MNKLQRFVRAALVATTLCVTLPSLALAQATTDANALVQQGVELRRQGRDADALDVFRRAYQAGGGPHALAQMGLAEQALGRWADAGTHLHDALDAQSDPWVASHAAALNSAMATIDRHLGTLDVIADVAGAEVWIDGVRVATLPLTRPLRLEVGEVHMEVRSPGHLPVQHTVEIANGVPARESVHLVEVPSTSQPISSGGSTSSSSTGATAPVGSGPMTPAARTTVGVVPPLVVMGIGAVGLLVGGILIGARNVAQGSCQAQGNDLVCPDANAAMQAASAPGLNDGALVAFGIGAFAVLAGGAWLLVQAVRSSDAPHSALRFGVAPLASGGVGFGVGGAF